MGPINNHVDMTTHLPPWTFFMHCTKTAKFRPPTHPLLSTWLLISPYKGLTLYFKEEYAMNDSQGLCMLEILDFQIVGISVTFVTIK